MLDKIRGMMGLAMRAGQVTLGANLALNVIKSSKAALVLVDETASENTRKKVSDACSYRKIPMYYLPEGLIDDACGKDCRYVAALHAGGLAAKIRQLIDSQGIPDQINQNHECAKRGGASVE